MDNQHKLIRGYRELSQEEIDLMNRIKEAGGKLLQLQAELAMKLTKDYQAMLARADDQTLSSEEREAANFELDRRSLAEPYRWIAIGKTDIQTGVMALVRAVAQPTDN